MKSKLQTKREEANLTIKELAAKAAVNNDFVSSRHLELTIEYIETGSLICPKPRKMYEWKALAKALKCDVMDIWEKR